MCGLPGGLIANPPLVDEDRRIVVGFDSGNGVLAAFDLVATGRCRRAGRHAQNHASHLLLFPDTGELVSAHHDGDRMAEQVVVRDISTGDELARADTGGPLQSAVFPAAGWDDDAYLTCFTTLTRISTA